MPVLMTRIGHGEGMRGLLHPTLHIAPVDDIRTHAPFFQEKLVKTRNFHPGPIRHWLIDPQGRGG